MFKNILIAVINILTECIDKSIDNVTYLDVLISVMSGIRLSSACQNDKSMWLIRCLYLAEDRWEEVQ